MTHRVALKLVALALAAFVVAAGCGRSDLNPYVYGGDATSDVANDAGPCDAITCAQGCCDSTGTCRSGTELNACGFGGASCNDCVAQGFEFCDPQVKACVNEQPTCDVTSCAAGCCILFDGQNACVSGVSSLACGTSGNTCADCTQSGEQCDPNSHACVAAPCGPNTCNGCCAGNTCVTTESDAQCGTGGLACTDCTQSGETCNAGTCATTCNAQTCPGCCEQGTCFAGFVDTRCGSGGAACVDCTTQQSTCDTLATPRQCKSQQNTCPATYASCPSNVSTPVLSVTKGACLASDLQDAEAACTTGFTSSACQSFFASEPKINASCATCLAPFQYDLAVGTGIFDCVSPYVGSSCDHDTGCIDDCEVQSCAQCPQNAVAQCKQQVAQGQCASYIQGASCIGSALLGQASFCNPQQYQGNYGDWLAGVGAHYCE